MIDPRNLDTLLHPQFDAAALKAATPAGKGLGASPGAACGKVVFTVMMLLNGMQEEKRLYLYVLKHLQKISQV